MTVPSDPPNNDATDWSSVKSEPIVLGRDAADIDSIKLFVPAESDVWIAFVADAEPEPDHVALVLLLVDGVAVVGSGVVVEARDTFPNAGARWARVRAKQGWRVFALGARGPGCVHRSVLHVTTRDPYAPEWGPGGRVPGQMFPTKAPTVADLSADARRWPILNGLDLTPPLSLTEPSLEDVRQAVSQEPARTVPSNPENPSVALAEQSALPAYPNRGTTTHRTAAEDAHEHVPRHLRLALASATRAFERGELLSLATINETIQPLVDAAIAYARRQGPIQTRADFSAAADAHAEAERTADGILRSIRHAVTERNEGLIGHEAFYERVAALVPPFPRSGKAFPGSREP